MQNLNVITPQWEYLDFSVNDEGTIVVSVAGEFSDTEKVSKKKACEIVNDPWFYAMFREAFDHATGPLREAFDRMRFGDRQIVLNFENIATVH